MTITSETNRAAYLGNGATTSFAYGWRILDEDDLVVGLLDLSDFSSVVQTITTHYTVSGVGNPGGGNVVFVTPPPTGFSVVIYSDPPITQLIDLMSGQAISAEVLEMALDTLVNQIKRCKEIGERSLRMPDIDGTLSPILPPALGRANKLLGFDSSGNPSVAVLGSETIAASQVTSGTFANARISQGSVTQHAAAVGALLSLAASQITSGTFANARIASGNVTQHQAALALSATQLTTGTLSNARVAVGNVTQHQASLAIDESQVANSLGRLLASLTFTNQASMDVTGILSGTYNAYRLVLRSVIPLSSAVALYLRMSTDDGSSWIAGTNYDWLPIGSNGTIQLTGAGSTAQIVVSGGGLLFLDNAGVRNRLMGEILLDTGGTFQVPSITSALKYENSAGALTIAKTAGHYRTGSTINAVQLLCSSGNISGNVDVYGLRT